MIGSCKIWCGPNPQLAGLETGLDRLVSISYTQTQEEMRARAKAGPRVS